MQLTAGTETGPCKRAPNAPFSPHLLTCVFFHINIAKPSFCGKNDLKNTRLISQRPPLDKQAKPFPCPIACHGCDGEGAGAPPLSKGSRRHSRTYPSTSFPHFGAAKSCKTPRRRKNGAGASPPRNQYLPMPGWCPGTNILVIQRCFFHHGPGFSKGPNGTHRACTVQGGIVRLVVKQEPSTSDKLTK